MPDLAAAAAAAGLSKLYPALAAAATAPVAGVTLPDGIQVLAGKLGANFDDPSLVDWVPGTVIRPPRSCPAGTAACSRTGPIGRGRSGATTGGHARPRLLGGGGPIFGFVVTSSLSALAPLAALAWPRAPARRPQESAPPCGSSAGEGCAGAPDGGGEGALASELDQEAAQHADFLFGGRGQARGTEAASLARMRRARRCGVARRERRLRGDIDVGTRSAQKHQDHRQTLDSRSPYRGWLVEGCSPLHNRVSLPPITLWAPGRHGENRPVHLSRAYLAHLRQKTYVLRVTILCPALWALSTLVPRKVQEASELCDGLGDALPEVESIGSWAWPGVGSSLLNVEASDDVAMWLAHWAHEGDAVLAAVLAQPLILQLLLRGARDVVLDLLQHGVAEVEHACVIQPRRLTVATDAMMGPLLARVPGSALSLSSVSGVDLPLLLPSIAAATFFLSSVSLESAMCLVLLLMCWPSAVEEASVTVFPSAPRETAAGGQRPQDSTAAHRTGLGKYGFGIQPTLDNRAASIDRIDPDGILARWNMENPAQAVKIGDTLVCVNGVSDSLDDMEQELRTANLSMLFEPC
ncbi:unnamed protein product [Prorocentrum cordatum]|uniref:PDZ domain-containing protein n=1 Tax=Prorocentrum cordatum TaxID=2364126 RepID=A0ABN9WDA7_9DINO|nr:unnamed protein product [Polarella glacialis]